MQLVYIYYLHAVTDHTKYKFYYILNIVKQPNIARSWVIWYGNYMSLPVILDLEKKKRVRDLR